MKALEDNTCIHGQLHILRARTAARCFGRVKPDNDAGVELNTNSQGEDSTCAQIDMTHERGFKKTGMLSAWCLTPYSCAFDSDTLLERCAAC
jgi:hypothetical protein